MSSSLAQRPIETNKNPIDRRFLLFQLDLSGNEARQFTALNTFTVQRDSSNPGSNFKFIDPIDYENVASPLYWRNILDPTYKSTFKDTFTKFRDDFLQAVRSGVIKLRGGLGTIPFRDITPLVKQISQFNVSLATTANDLTVDLGPTEALADFNILRNPRKTVDQKTLNSTFNQLLLDADISENDVLMTRVSYDNGKTYQMEYVGFVTKISTSRRYGSVDTAQLVLTGVSKIFEINSLIKQASVRPEQFLPNIEVNELSSPSIYENRFNSLDNRGIFETLMQEVLALRADPSARFDDPNLLAFYNNDDIFFSDNANAGFQFNMFVLLTLDLMSRASVDPESQEFARLFPKTFPGGTTTGQRAGSRVVLDSTVRAVLRHGEHQTFNLMIASGFENFFAQLDNAQSIFSELRSHTYYDVFESRDGVIVCRPPMYNKIELNFGETVRKNLSLLERDIDKILVFNPETKAWDFRPDADYYIKAEDLAADVDFDKNDATLRTRADTQFTLRTVGVQDFPAGSYTDPNLLVRYGLRTEGPINNPNATNPALATLFAPIALNIDNASTRTSKVRVWDTRPYQVGKLYFIESENVVGYCVNHNISAQYQKLGVSELDLIMVRRVVDRPISDILKTDNEVINFALMYLADPAATKKDSPSQASKMRQQLLASGRAMLEKLAKLGAGIPISPDEQQDEARQDAIEAIGKDKRAIEAQLAARAAGRGELRKDITVPMFKYVPTILDLLIDVEDNPIRTSPQETVVDTSGQASRETTRRRQTTEDAIVRDNNLYATELRRFDGDLWKDKWFQTMENAVSDRTPDKNTGDFFPPVGAYQYSNLVNSGRSTQDRPAIMGVRTPFEVSKISELGSGLSFSQLLLNRLASFDLGMKYVPRFGVAAHVNPDGFPQLYGLVRGNYRLFGTNMPPREYLQSVAPGLVYGTDPKAFQSLFPGLPNTLQMNAAGNELSNGFFRIPSNAGRFRLPYGHLVYLESSSPSILSLKFVGVSGGVYQVTKTAPTQFKFQAGKNAALFFDENASTVQADFPGPGVDEGTLVEDAVLSGTVEFKTELTLAPPSGRLYFISPFTDMTIERMLEWGLPARIAGVRKSSDTATLLKTTNKALLGDKDQHLKGRGFDFCPELLTCNSGSDLLVLPATFARLRTLLQNAGFDSSNVHSLLGLPTNTVKITWQYLDGSAGGNSAFGNQSPFSAKMYYHVGVTDSEVDKDVKAQKPVTPSGTVPLLNQILLGESEA